MRQQLGTSIVALITCTLLATTSAAAVIADHNAAAEFADIPDEYFDQIRAEFNFFYGHTSHGSQIMSGIGMLRDENIEKYTSPYFHEISDDLGHAGDTSWVQPTRDYLDSNPECNVVMWSWCGGVTDNTEEGIDIYLAAMSQLELDYPEVTFIYMTGHLAGGGLDGNLFIRNNQIRDYCLENDKVLFDFADIETWDPDGDFYPDDGDECDWCYEWCAVHDCPTCSYCAHSHCLNCYLKGKAFWWMMARLSGWSGLAAAGYPAPVTTGLRLDANFPNPFNPRTTICFHLSRQAATTVDVFDVQGRCVATVCESILDPGRHELLWEARNDEGRPLSSGAYFCRVQAADDVAIQTMVLLK